MFPTKEQAVIVDSTEKYQIKDYAQAFAKVINPSDIRFLSRISNNRVCVFVSSKSIAEDLVEKQKCIKINDQTIPIRYLINRNRRIILSNVCPIIPHREIENKLLEYKIEPMSPISFLRAGINEVGFNHILSFRRQMYVSPEDFDRIPERIQINFEDTSYWIYLSSDALTCFQCKQIGHTSNQCPNTKNGSNVNQDLEQPLVIEESGINLPFKRPHPPTVSTKSSENTMQIADIDPLSDSDCSQDSSEPLAETISNTKKLRKSPKFDSDNTDWVPIEKLVSTNPQFPLNFPQLQSFFENSFGVKDIAPVAEKYTQDTTALICMLKEIIPTVINRSLKNRITRLITKLKSTVITPE